MRRGVREQARPLEVRQELVPEAHSLARALDQPRHVCDGELARRVGRVDRPEHGCERRERILRHLRPGVRDAGQERRLAGVRQTDESGIRQELEPEIERRLFAEQTRLGEARGPAGRRREVLVAAAGQPSPRDDDARIGRGEIRDQAAVLVEHLGPDGDTKLDRLARRPVLQRAAAGRTAACPVPSLHTKSRQIAQIRVRDQNDVASRSAVATVGAALGDVLLTAKVQAPVAAAARLDVGA